MKKLIAIFLVVSMLFGFTVISSAADLNGGATAEAQRFNDDGSFKIMHITDTHLHNDKAMPKTLFLLEKMLDEEKPDLVVITGDIAMSGDYEEITYCIDCLMSIFEERNIPVAVTFGNHDAEISFLSTSELMAIYNSYDCSISVDDGALLSGCGTYNVPILASDSDDIAFNLWMVDSGSTDGEGHYDYVKTDQIDWYVAKSNALKAQNGGEPVPSLLFQHIIVPEIYDALIETDTKTIYSFEHIYEDGKYYMLNPENTNSGGLFEYPCPPYYNNGEFEAAVNQGDVLAMFFGHDHSNTFNITHNGIDLVNTPKASYSGNAYGVTKGVRIIELNESDTSTYTDRVLTFGDLYDLSDIFDILFSDSEDKCLEFSLASTTVFVKFFIDLYMNYLISIPEFLTGRVFNY